MVNTPRALFWRQILISTRSCDIFTYHCSVAYPETTSGSEVSIEIIPLAILRVRSQYMIAPRKLLEFIG
jgi:hypothetical protein